VRDPILVGMTQVDVLRRVFKESCRLTLSLLSCLRAMAAQSWARKSRTTDVNLPLSLPSSLLSSLKGGPPTRVAFLFFFCCFLVPALSRLC